MSCSQPIPLSLMVKVQTFDCTYGQTLERQAHPRSACMVEAVKIVAREFAWLSPDRQDLLSPPRSVLTVSLLPALCMKWKSSNYVLCLLI